MSKVKAVLFDFGGVFTQSPFSAVEELGTQLGIPPLEFREIMFGPYSEDTDHPWHQLERGEISLEDCRTAIKTMGEAKGHNVDLYDLLAHMASNSEKLIHNVLVDFVRELKTQDLKTAIITNNVKEFSSAWREMLPVAELFDIIIDSSEVGIRKPNGTIYQMALDQLGNIPAEQAIFLDDYQDNVTAAESLGIAGIHVSEDPYKTIADLSRALLIKEPS